MEKPFVILSIFAHPDDEIGAGSTFARYSDAGHRIVLVCASRGEAATIYCADCATPETLAEVRTRELECACHHLGIGELRWLDWPDGGIKDLPRPEAVGQVVKLIREIQPDIIVTHPENGLYPHPDHLAVWEIVRAAFDAAADDDAYPPFPGVPGLSQEDAAQAGAPWATPRLFTRALPQSILERAPSLAEFRVELNGQLLPFLSVPDEQIDVWMRVAPWVERRMAAWNCHQSQHNPRGFSTTMPDGLQQDMAENESFLLVAARVPLPEGVNDDLLAGLEPGQGDGVRRQASGRKSDGPSAAEVRSALAAQRAYLEVCDEYARRSIELGFAGIARTLAGGHQEAIYLLARALRRAGEPAGEVAADPKILNDGMRRRKTADQAAFLSAAAPQIAAFCQAKAAESPADEAATWKELAALVSAQAQGLRPFSG